MTREQILEKHYGKARGEIALLWAFVPFIAAALLAVFLSDHVGPVSRRGGGFYGLLAIVPLLLLRDKLKDKPPLGYAVSVIVPALGGYLASGTIWLALVCAALGGVGAWVYYWKVSAASGRPKLNALGQNRLNDDLRAAGFEEEVF